MSSLALSKLGRINNSATTYVVLSAANKLKSKPMIPLPADDHHHHDDHHMSLPNRAAPSALGSLLLRGNLQVTNSFTSNARNRPKIVSIYLFFFENE